MFALLFVAVAGCGGGSNATDAAYEAAAPLTDRVGTNTPDDRAADAAAPPTDRAPTNRPDGNAGDAGVDAPTSPIDRAGANTLDGDGDDAGDDASTPSSGERALAVNELIEQDLADGKIDAKTAALYQLLAEFSPSRLPPQYQAEQLLAGLPSVLPLVRTQAHLAEYAATEKAAVQAMLTDPEDPSWMTFPAGMPASNFVYTSRSCRENFDADKNGTGVGGRFLGTIIETEHFLIRALLPTTTQVPRQQQLKDRIDTALSQFVPDVGGGGSVALRDYLDHVYNYYSTTLKMNEPSGLAKALQRGGKTKLPIYITTCDGAANDAFASPSGFIFASVGAALEDADFRRIVIPHELFHLFEYAYIQAGVEGQEWPFEGCAVGVEDLVAPGVRRWSGQFKDTPIFPQGTLDPMDRSFRCPEEPLHNVLYGACQNRGGAQAPRYGGDYSKFVLIKFLVRNKALVLGDFWQKYAAAGGDPKKLIVERDVAEFQVALIGDAQDKLYFDAEDRTAFYNSGKTDACDFETQDVKRYTYWLDTNKLAESKLLRAAPSDDSARLASEGLSKLDAAMLQVQPWGTQRLLIEVPAQASDGDPNVELFRFFLKYKNVSSVSPSIVSFDGSGQPGRIFKAEGILAPSPTAPPTTSYSRGSGTLPGFLLVFLSNFGAGPLSYEAAVNFPSACSKACNDYYTQQIDGQGCMEKWCWQDCSNASTAVTCQDSVQKCVQKVNTSISDAADMEKGYFCSYMCSPFKDLEKPVSVPCNMPCMLCWDEKICGGTCDQNKPAAFYSTREWPQMECINWLAAGQVKCH
jgi:hypothetical protein